MKQQIIPFLIKPIKNFCTNIIANNMFKEW